MKTGIEDYFIIKNNKKMQFGYTTGSCAAAATLGAVRMLLSGDEISSVVLDTPKGITLNLELLDIKRDENSVICGVKKIAGDDPDVTDGAVVYAKAELASRVDAEKVAAVFNSEKNSKEAKSLDGADPEDAVIGINGGEGVGVVTKAGLEQPIGAVAINKIPRQMITFAALEACREFGYSDGIIVTISIPAGVKLAEKTFNPRLGIEGGISVLGTSGIVEPMSEQALIASIELEMKQKIIQNGPYILATPGNYGSDFLDKNYHEYYDKSVKCSNYIGQTIDLAVNNGAKGILLVAHIGKLIKIASGIMNTHSHEADARMETLAACAIRAGADSDIAKKILDSLTTDEGLRILKGTPYWDKAIQIMMEKVEYYMNFRCQGSIKVGAIAFSNVYGELGRSKNANALLGKLLR